MTGEIASQLKSNSILSAEIYKAAAKIYIMAVSKPSIIKGFRERDICEQMGGCEVVYILMLYIPIPEKHFCHTHLCQSIIIKHLYYLFCVI